MTYYIAITLIILFIAIPTFASYHFQIGIHRQIGIALSKMLIRLGILSVISYYIIVWNSILPTILFMLLLIGYTSTTILLKARLRLRPYIIPIATGTLVASLLIGTSVSILCVTANNTFSVRYVLPMFAIVVGSLVEGLSKSLATYYSGLRNNNQLYYFLLYNGASSQEALRYLMRKAIKRAFIPSIAKMAGMSVGISPVIMWTMIMCGTSVLDAFLFQVILMLATLSGAIISVVTSLFVARHYIVDDYGKIANE